MYEKKINRAKSNRERKQELMKQQKNGNPGLDEEDFDKLIELQTDIENAEIKLDNLENEEGEDLKPVLDAEHRIEYLKNDYGKDVDVMDYRDYERRDVEKGIKLREEYEIKLRKQRNIVDKNKRLLKEAIDDLLYYKTTEGIAELKKQEELRDYTKVLQERERQRLEEESRKYELTEHRFAPGRLTPQEMESINARLAATNNKTQTGPGPSSYKFNHDKPEVGEGYLFMAQGIKSGGKKTRRKLKKSKKKKTKKRRKTKRRKTKRRSK